jgi:hypothetical protein
VAAGDGGLVFVSGAKGEWTDVAAVDTARGRVVARWGGVWNRSFLRLSPDHKRLYYSTQGVTPGHLDALVIPKKLDERPVTYRASVRADVPLGGDFQVTPDGRFLLHRTGAVLRTAPTPDADLKHVTTLEPFLAAAVDVEGGALFTLTEDAGLRHYSYPEFKLQGVYRLPGVGYQAACDGKQGRLYVAVLDPRALTARPRARGFSDVHVYDVRELLRGKQAARGKE